MAFDKQNVSNSEELNKIAINGELQTTMAMAA
jgi:hypothetical protein